MAMERFANFSDEVTEGRSSVRAGWTKWLVRKQLTEIGRLEGLKRVVG